MTRPPSDSDRPPKPAARLSGRDLDAFYARDVPHGPKPKSAAIEGPSKPPMRVLGKSPWILVWLSVLMTFSAFVPPLSLLGAGVLGIWMVIGRENFWLRIIITAVYFLPSFWYPIALCIGLLIVLTCTVLMSYLVNIFLKRFSKIPVRSAQFGLWEIGGWILALSFLFAFFRLADIPLEHIHPLEAMMMSLSVGAVALNVVLACCPFFVPKSLRFDKLWIVAVVTPLLVMPLIETVFCCSFAAISGRIDSAGVAMATFAFMVMHPFGYLFVMLLAWPMDADDYFRSEAPIKS